MSVTLNFGWPLPKDREQLLEILVRERLIDIDAALAPGGTRWLASAYHNANQSIANGPISGWVTLALNSENVDTKGMHDNSTNNSRITVPKAGVYAGMGKVVFAASGAGSVRAARAIVNGSAAAIVGLKQVPPVSGSASTVVCFPVFPRAYALNDYLQLQAYQDSGGSLNALGDVPNGYYCELALYLL